MILRSILLATAVIAATPAAAQSFGTLDRNGGLVSVAAYGPNIVHVTIALDRGEIDRGAGYGFTAKPSVSGWSHRRAASGDVYSSSALNVTVSAQPWPKAPSLMERYFVSALPPVSITIRGADNREITRLNGWEMAPQTINGEKTFRVGASFADTADTHYFGLGQNQEGILDLRARMIDCRHNYDAPADETVCVLFLVTNKGYGILWDNPSATTVSPGLHGATRFHSQVGERVSFFIITGKTSDELYAGYAKLTGETPLPPKAAFGLIQSKARYGKPERDDGDRRGISQPQLSARYHGARLVPLDADGPAGHRPEFLPRSFGDEPAAPRLGHAFDHQRVAAFRA